MSDKEIAVSIIIPTYNEAENIAGIVKRVIGSLDSCSGGYEILVVDDASGDNTAAIAEEALGASGRVIRRISDRKSLSLSVLDGIKESKGRAIAVMDADGSHPPELLPAFIKEINNGYDLVIASRYCKGGGTKDFPLKRKLISGFACFIGRLVTDIRDNTSGFFCIRKSTLKDAALTPDGFKIGLEIFVKANHGSFKEIPYVFTDRTKGKSKLKSKVVFQYLVQIAKLSAYRLSGKKCR